MSKNIYETYENETMEMVKEKEAKFIREILAMIAYFIDKDNEEMRTKTDEEKIRLAHNWLCKKMPIFVDDISDGLALITNRTVNNLSFPDMIKALKDLKDYTKKKEKEND